MKKQFGKIIAIFLMCVMMVEMVTASENITVYPSNSDNKTYTVAGDASELPDMLAQSAIVVDMSTGYTLVEKNIMDKHYPASITKIMTAILTLENVKMDEVVTFSSEAVFSIEKNSSAACVDVDEQLTVEQCLYGLMLISGNDLANGLAEHVGGTMTVFANMMTDKAKELGCENTSFANAHGLHDDNHYTTVYDMAIIAKYAYDNVKGTYEKESGKELSFKTLCSTGYYECMPTNKQPEVRKWRNNNRLINKYKEEYYEDCIGGKTGYTDKAGGTLVTFAKINGRTLMCVVMKSANTITAYADTTNLYDYIKENVGQEVYAKFDEEYAKLHQSTEEPTVNISHENETENKTSPKAEKSKEDGGMWIGWKILILAVTVFIIYYIYIQYMRYQRRKRRRLMRMQRRREAEMQNRG